MEVVTTLLEPCQGGYYQQRALWRVFRTGATQWTEDPTIEYETRVRQRCLLSSLLFLVALDWMTRTAFDRKRGIQWTFTTSLEDLDLADDLALLSHRVQDMRDKVQR